MKFYFNDDYNKCMDEDSLIEFIQDIAEIEDPEIIRDELHSRREFCGWYECEVSGSIRSKFCP